MAAVGCATVTGAPVGEPGRENDQEKSTTTGIEEEKKMTVQVQIGQKAPDFTAPAFLNGDFTQIKLSDYLGKWVLLCFYPGDYTFV